MAKTYNKKPISLREGKVFIDGVQVYDQVKCTIKFTPDVWTGKLLGEQSNSSRWLGYNLSGNMTRRRATNWLATIIKQYIKDKKTPEMIIQGICDDPDSDYYATYGTNTVTVAGCVITGDIQLLALDSAGDVLDDTISFNAKELVQA